MPRRVPRRRLTEMLHWTSRDSRPRAANSRAHQMRAKNPRSSASGSRSITYASESAVSVKITRRPRLDRHEGRVEGRHLVLGQPREVGAAEIIPQRRPRALGVDVVGPAPRQHIVAVHGAEVDAETRAARRVVHGRMHLRGRGEDGPADVAEQPKLRDRLDLLFGAGLLAGVLLD